MVKNNTNKLNIRKVPMVYFEPKYSNTVSIHLTGVFEKYPRPEYMSTGIK